MKLKHKGDFKTSRSVQSGLPASGRVPLLPHVEALPLAYRAPAAHYQLRVRPVLPPSLPSSLPSTSAQRPLPSTLVGFGFHSAQPWAVRSFACATPGLADRRSNLGPQGGAGTLDRLHLSCVGVSSSPEGGSTTWAFRPWLLCPPGPSWQTEVGLESGNAHYGEGPRGASGANGCTMLGTEQI